VRETEEEESVLTIWLAEGCGVVSFIATSSVATHRFTKNVLAQTQRSFSYKA
jgi:hypothetical protein